MKQSQKPKVNILIIICILVFSLLSGCQLLTQIDESLLQETKNQQEEESQEGETKKTENQNNEINFSLPDGWSISKEGGHISAFRREQPPNSAAQSILLEFINIQSSENENAKELALEFFHEKEDPPKFDEIKIGNLKVYTIEQIAGSYWGGPWSVTNIFFEKNEKIVHIELNDKLTNQYEAIKMLTETLNWD